MVVDPLELFGYCSDGVRLQWGIEALEAPIHGDLNLENLIFSIPVDDELRLEQREGLGPAWLVDFDSAVERGMVALDPAKLEVEIWNHQILPLLGRDSRAREAVEDLGRILKLVDERALAGEKELPGRKWDDRLRDRLNGLLAITFSLRRFLDELGVTAEEAGWARSAYAFASLKFLRKGRAAPGREMDPVLLAYAAAGWHLSGVVPGRGGPRRSVCRGGAAWCGIDHGSAPGRVHPGRREGVSQACNGLQGRGWAD